LGFIPTEPGTYFLTRGYLGEAEDFIVSGFSEIRDKYDKETLQWIVKEMLKLTFRTFFVKNIIFFIPLIFKPTPIIY